MANLVAFTIVVLLLILLGVIVRFSIVSPRKMKGSQSRLRYPDPTGVEGVCGFSPPEELLALYRTAPFISMTEVYLVDKSKAPSKAWFIGGFFPLTPTDLAEVSKITGVRDAIPIADDLTKGTYIVSKTGSILLRSPNIEGGEVEVATGAREFAFFEIHREWGLDS